MKITDVLDPILVGEIIDRTVLGIDIGSRGSKAVLLYKGQMFAATVPTGVNMQESANELFEELLEEAAINRNAVEFIVGTGYGRIALQFINIPSEIITEISCHAMGAHYLHAPTRTIIDIGGQDSKAIEIDPATGKVVKFIMNDKCAAGTGRFLEKAAGLLEYTIDEIGPASLRADNPSQISSQCVVFAESEIVSLRARGESPENIAAGTHFASARRVKNLVNRIALKPDLVFTGGVSNNVGMKRALEELVGHAITMPRLDTIYAGALGAAVYAQRYLTEGRDVRSKGKGLVAADLADVSSRIANAEQAFIEAKDIKKIGYLCTYTPIELLAASDAKFIRLMKCGDQEVVSQGEVITKSNSCDFVKSIVGNFARKDPLHAAIDEVLTFQTCDSMRATAEAINNFFIPARSYTVPRNSERDSVRKFFRQEILSFRSDLQNLTGKVISDADVSEKIRIYNRIRGQLRKISALRKRDNPPIGGRDFLEIARSFFYLDAEELVVMLDDLYNRLASVPDEGTPPLRLMMAGGIVADGDRRILDLIEDEIGASIVVEDHCIGLGPFSQNTNENVDPWQALAESYLDKAPCARQFPLENRLNFSANLAEEYRVDGVIYAYLKFCPCYGMTNNAFVSRFQSLGLPVLELATDYSEGDTGQIKTRLEAFFELIQEKNENFHQ
jgi:predicted CoA-substrate-specific enzyme activase